MDLKIFKLQKLEKALKSFEAVVRKDLNNEFFRDSAIQRFEYTIEIFWKTLKVVLKEDYDIQSITPRDVIKKSCSTEILSNEQSVIILEMLKIRNETSHEYAVNIAKVLAPKLSDFSKLLRTVYQKIK